MLHNRFFQIPADPDKLGDTIIVELLAGDTGELTPFGYIVSTTGAHGTVGGVEFGANQEHWFVDSSLSGADLASLLEGAQQLALYIAAGGTWEIMKPAVLALMDKSKHQFDDKADLSESDWAGGSYDRPDPTYAFEGTDIDGTTPIRFLIAPDTEGSPAIKQVVWESDAKPAHYFNGDPTISSEILLTQVSPLPSELENHHIAP